MQEETQGQVGVQAARTETVAAEDGPREGKGTISNRSTISEEAVGEDKRRKQEYRDEYVAFQELQEKKKRVTSRKRNQKQQQEQREESAGELRRGDKQEEPAVPKAEGSKEAGAMGEEASPEGGKNNGRSKSKVKERHEEGVEKQEQEQEKKRSRKKRLKAEG